MIHKDYWLSGRAVGKLAERHVAEDACDFGPCSRNSHLFEIRLLEGSNNLLVIFYCVFFFLHMTSHFKLRVGHTFIFYNFCCYTIFM